MTKTLTPLPEKVVDWILCPGCRALGYAKRLARELYVCPECGHHHRLTARQRVEMLLDEGWAEPLTQPVRSGDPLEFVDTRPYPVRVERARAATGLVEGVLVASGTIEGNPVVVAALDFEFMGGSLGSAIGELITLAAEHALTRRVPLLIVSASGGARMQEGAIALMQMAKTGSALGQLDESGILTISLATDPTYGGVAASFATLCDVIVAEPGARLGFAGPRVIEQTIRRRLPECFQTAEFLLAHGFVDMIRPRPALRPTLARLLATGGETGDAGPDPVIRDPDALAPVDPWQVVRQARDLDRPTTLDYVALIFDEFEELHGDRVGGDCPAMVGGIARLDGTKVMVIGHQKGRTAAELDARNYGMPNPEGYRKAARLMRMAAKLGLPIVSFIDTPGAYPGLEAEERGQAVAIAENIRLMPGLATPIVTIVTGEGGSGGALALAVADDVLIFSGGVYSVISPEGCAAILWHDPAKAPEAAAALRLDAGELLRLGVVDGVLPEPTGGVQADRSEAGRRLRSALAASLHRLSKTDTAELVRLRRARFRSYGAETGE